MWGFQLRDDKLLRLGCGGKPAGWMPARSGAGRPCWPARPCRPDGPEVLASVGQLALPGQQASQGVPECLAPLAALAAAHGLVCGHGPPLAQNAGSTLVDLLLTPSREIVWRVYRWCCPGACSYR